MKKLFIACVIALFSFQGAFALTKIEEKKVDAFLKTAQGHLKKGNVESAKRLAEKVLNIDPENIGALEIIGDTESNPAVDGILDGMDISQGGEIEEKEPEIQGDTINKSSSIGALVEQYKPQIAIFTVLFTLGIIAMFMPSTPKKKVVKKVVKKEEGTGVLSKDKLEISEAKTNKDALKELEELF